MLNNIKYLVSHRRWHARSVYRFSYSVRNFPLRMSREERDVIDMFILEYVMVTDSTDNMYVCK